MRPETQENEEEKSVGGVSRSGPDVIDDLKRYLNKRASKSPMGRDTDMSLINTKLRSLNVEVQGIYSNNL